MRPGFLYSLNNAPGTKENKMYLIDLVLEELRGYMATTSEKNPLFVIDKFQQEVSQRLLE